MQRIELFSAVRDEKGDLVLYFPDSDLVVVPKERKFWERVFKMIQDELKSEKLEWVDRERLKKTLEVVKSFLEKRKTKNMRYKPFSRLKEKGE